VKSGTNGLKDEKYLLPEKNSANKNLVKSRD
jgi:hypothetical protein